MTDHELLREYAAQGSEDAFAALVTRYVRLVYSAAFRQCGNAQDAEDITQAVFVILARKAGGLRQNTVLAGWLLRTTRFVALNAWRRQSQRLRRDSDLMIEQQTDTQAAWEQLAPFLDEALARLSMKDRDAVVLRYFQQQSFKGIAGIMHGTEDGAQKRVTRALAKLRAYFQKHGLMLAPEHIVTALVANSVQDAPVHLAMTVATVAKSGAALTGSVSVLVSAGLAAWKTARLKTLGLWAIAAAIMLPPPALVVAHFLRVDPLAKLSVACIATSADGTKLAATVSGRGLIYTSKNSGVSWQATGAPEGYWNAVASSADGSKLLAAGADYVRVPNQRDRWGTPSTPWIYTSTNFGVTWTRATAAQTNASWTCAACSADGAKLVLAAGLGGVHTSSDAGLTWTRTSAPNKQWQSLACSADGSRLVALAAGGGLYDGSMAAKGLLYTSDETGQTSHDFTRNLMISVKGGIYVSADAGVSWKQTPLPGDLWWCSVAASPDGSRLIAATTGKMGRVMDRRTNSDGTLTYTSTSKLTAGGSVYVSADSGASWQLTSAPGNAWASVASSGDATTLVAVSRFFEPPWPAGSVWTSRDSGTTWTAAKIPGTNWTYVAASADGHKIFAGGKSGGIRVLH